MAPLDEFAVGFLPMQGDDYAFGLEARGQVSRHSDGFEYGLTFGIVAQLRK